MEKSLSPIAIAMLWLVALGLCLTALKYEGWQIIAAVYTPVVLSASIGAVFGRAKLGFVVGALLLYVGLICSGLLANLLWR